MTHYTTINEYYVNSYGEENSDTIMLLYNVDNDEEFKFDFKSDLIEDSTIGLYDAVTVHIFGKDITLVLDY